MSEMDPAQPEQQAAAGIASGKSAGTLLREAREAAGLHVGALAVSLKVPVKKLEALEADDLTQLPDAVFARALAATVCRSLKIDPEPILARLPQLPTRPLQVGSQQTPVRMDSQSAGLRFAALGGLPRPVVYLTAALLVGAFVVTLLPSLKGASDPSSVASPDGVAIRMVPNQSVTEAVAPVTMPIAEPMTAASAPEPAASGAMAESNAAATAQVVAASAATPQATSASDVPSTAATSAATESGAVAVFTTREPSWVEVVDAAGLVHLRKTMPGGQSVRINGTLPLTVVIGRANAIDIVVRGKPFDLAPVTKGNIARFQIK
jgi:cytoskeleton protein RodZ